MPVFVARDLSSLPAVSANSIDVALLMRDIEAMKLQLLGLADMSAVSRQIVAAVESITKDRPPGGAPQQPVGSTCIVHAAVKEGALLHDNVDNEIESIAADGSNQAVSSPTDVRPDVEVSVRCEVDLADSEDASASTTAVNDVRYPSTAPRPRQNGDSVRSIDDVVASSPPPTDSRGFQHVTRHRSRNNRSSNNSMAASNNGIAASNNGIAASNNGIAASNNAHPRVSKTNSPTHLIGSDRQGADCGIQAAQRQSVRDGRSIHLASSR